MSHVWLIELKFITVRLSTIALRMVLKLSLLEKLIFWRFEISDRHNSSIRHGIQIFFSKIKNSTRLMHKYKNSSDSNHWKCLKSASTKHEIYMKSRYFRPIKTKKLPQKPEKILKIRSQVREFFVPPELKTHQNSKFFLRSF